MSMRRVFFVSNTRLTVYRRDGVVLPEPISFSADEEGLAEFARYVERYPDEVTHVIADVVEEEFRETAIPHVLGRDRRALLRTRAAKLFPDARYVHATKLGRSPDGRRDDRVLFSAITRLGVLAPWLTPIARHAVPLAGICSPAALTGAMLKAIGAEGKHVLVASLQSGGGLRQTCFQRGRLRLSRLAVMPEPAGDRYGSHVLAEIERTCRYLESLRPESPRSGALGTAADGSGGGRLKIFLLSHGEMLDELRREIVGDLRPGSDDGPRPGIGGGLSLGSGGERRTEAGGCLRRETHGDLRSGSGDGAQPEIGGEPWREIGGGLKFGIGGASRAGADGDLRHEIHGDLRSGSGDGRRPEIGDNLRAGIILVDLAGVARRLGIRRWGGEPEADRLFVQMLARRPASNHYATPEEMRCFTMLRARSCLKTASVLLVAGGCLFGGATFFEGFVAGGHARILAQQAAIYEDRYRKAQATLPPAPAEPAEIVRAVSLASELQARRGDPVDLLALISDALATFPRVRVESVSWQMSGDAEAQVSASHHAGGKAGPSGSARAGGPSPVRDGTGSRGEDDETARRNPDILFQLALVSARIDPFDGDYRAAIGTIHRFVEALAVPSRVEHVRILALPLDLSSHQTLTGGAGTSTGTAAFEIRVALRMTISDGKEA